MYEEKHWRTWDILLVPDSKSWNEVLIFLEERTVLGYPDINKIPALMWNDPPINEPEMEHKHKRRSAQEKYQVGLSNDKKEDG